MFGGRVKTLNPLIYSSLLYLRNDKTHEKEFLSLKFPQIDIVVVNLYPFKKSLKTNNHDSIIEMIDVGGPSLLRAAGKNFKYVTAITNIEDYKKLIVNLEFNKGVTDINFRKKMAFKVFNETYKYDRTISKWFNER